MNKKKIIIISVVVLAVLAIGAGFLGWKKSEIKKQEAVRMQQEQVKKQQDELGKQMVEVDTSDWKTYRNYEHGFKIRYPKNIAVTDFTTESIVFKDKEIGHWAYGLDIVPNKNNITLDDIDDIKKEFKIQGDVNIDDIVIDGVSAKKFLFKDYNDYGNSNIFLIYKNFIIRIAGDEAHGNDKEYYAFVNSLKFDK